MTERSQSILKTAIRDFIENGRPITSEYLYEEYDFGIKPAMIRLELNELSQTGYFFQNHPSGGRFPTNKAYRFFIREIIGSKDEDIYTSRKDKNLADEFLSGEHLPFIKQLSNYLNTLSIGYDSHAREIYESGLVELSNDLEVQEKRDLVSVIEDYESIIERLDGKKPMVKNGDKWLNIFVGKSPFSQSDCISVIVGNFISDESDFSLVLIGPKRMDYEKSISLFRTLKRLTNT